MSSVDKNTDGVNLPTPRKHDKKFVVRTYAMDVAAAKQKATSESSPSNTQTTQKPPIAIPTPPKLSQEKSPMKSASAETLKDATSAHPLPAITKIVPPKVAHVPNAPSIPIPTTHAQAVSVSNTLKIQAAQPAPKEDYTSAMVPKHEIKKEAPEIPTNLVIAHHNQDASSGSFFSNMWAWLMGKNGEVIPAKTEIHENIVVPNEGAPKAPAQLPPINISAKDLSRDTLRAPKLTQAPVTRPATPEISVVPPGMFQGIKMPNQTPSQEGEQAPPNLQTRKETTSPVPPIATPQVSMPPVAAAPPATPPSVQQKASSILGNVSSAPGNIPIGTKTPPKPHKSLRNKILSPLHTYKMDVTDTIEETNASATSILAGQQDAQPINNAPAGKEKRTLLWFAIGGALLLILSIVGTGYAYQYHAKKVAPAKVTIPVPSLVPTNATKELSGTGIALLNELAKAAQVPLQNGAIETVYIATSTKDSNGTIEKRPLPGGYLIAAMSLPMPRILMNNTAIDSTVGVVGANNQTYPFFILRVASYDSAFAGMLRWESSLAPDMRMLYPSPITKLPAVTTLTTTATSTQKSKSQNNSTVTTTATQTLHTPAGFVDETIANHNVRILRNASGQSILLYGFANKHTLVIVRDADAFIVILGKLNQQ